MWVWIAAVYTGLVLELIAFEEVLKDLLRCELIHWYVGRRNVRMISRFVVPVFSFPLCTLGPRCRQIIKYVFVLFQGS